MSTHHITLEDSSNQNETNIDQCLQNCLRVCDRKICLGQDEENQGEEEQTDEFDDNIKATRNEVDCMRVNFSFLFIFLFAQK